VMAQKGTSFGDNQDINAITTITQYLEIYGRGAWRSMSINVQAPNQETLAAAQDTAIGTMRLVRGLAPENPNDFEIFSNESLIEMFNKILDVVAAGALVISSIALLASGGVMFLFASRLGARIRRLRDAAERALDREGRVTPFPVTRSRDEVGDLTRSFASLLDQVAAYTDYLRSLSGKLSHELNTPLAIVRTSLDNLDSAGLPSDAQPYLTRARDGVERMGTLVRTMSEVTRIEHAIESAEAETFDLRALIADYAEGHRSLLLPRALRVELPAGPLKLRGSPDRVAQAPDKLFDNARGFCPPDGWVRLSLAAEGDGARISLANQGPPVPEAMRARLFDSLVSLREKPQRLEGATHLGFGLYVVKLVAELPRGHAQAHNLPNGEGVEFILHLRPMP